MIQKSLKLLKDLILKEPSVRIFAASFAIGGYIAFSPYLGLHTIMAFFFAWLFSLNVLVILAASNLINNPWTMVPVYYFGHVAGEKVLDNLCGIDAMAYNPWWVQWCNEWLKSGLGFEVSFWAFMLGGNLLGLLVAAMLYPTMKMVFARLMQQRMQN